MTAGYSWMNWSEINQTLGEFRSNLNRTSAKIRVARKLKQQIWHRNYRPWYAERMNVVRRRFLILKRRLVAYRSISRALQDLEQPFAVLLDLKTRKKTDIDNKLQAMEQAQRLCEILQSEVTTQQQRKYDILPRESVETDERLCFVMMPFKPRKFFDPVYKTIRQTLKKKHMKCVRSDNVFDTRAIVWDIWENIRRARVCIADISDINPNVFYELGMAHSVITRTILISRRLAKDEKHVFDVNYVRCIYYMNTKTGLQILGRNISRTLTTILK
jgi:hypothetical protein